MRKFLIFLMCFVLLAVPAAANENRIVDEADLLTGQEENTLETFAADFAANYGMDMVIVTNYSLEGKTAQAFADDYFDYNGYGVGQDFSGVLLLISMDTREWAVSTCGDAIWRLDDYTIDSIMDDILYDLSDGAYYAAFAGFIDSVQAHLDSLEVSLQPEYDDNVAYYDPYPGYQRQLTTGDILGRLLIAVLIGCAAGGIVIFFMIRSMNTARAQSGAGGYLERGLQLTQRQDIFLYSHTTRTAKPQDNGGHGGRGGGGGSHRSSSGRSHGGRSGRF